MINHIKWHLQVDNNQEWKDLLSINNLKVWDLLFLIHKISKVILNQQSIKQLLNRNPVYKKKQMINNT